MPKANRPPRAPRQERTLTLTRNFYWYLVLFVGALIFTQALRSPASSIFFTFVFLLPLASLAYTLSAKATLKIFMLSDSATTEKLTPFTYEFRIINEFFLPYPFTTAMISLPQKNSVRCREREVYVAMPPATSYTVRNTVSFPFRGTYEIGVRAIYVHDFFKMFRLRLDFDNYSTVYVLPRRLNRNTGNKEAVSDSPDISQKSIYAVDKTEVEDVRLYMSGDPLKSIHWKLSSKTEDFIVRDYSTGGSKNTFVYCDLSARHPTKPPAVEAPPPPSPAPKEKKPRRTPSYADPDIVELSDEAIAEHNDNAKKKAESAGKRLRDNKKKREKKKAADKTPPVVKEEESAPEHGTLADPSFYEDMNEFCADGVVELTCSTVLRELRRGNFCTLLWYDRRSENGVFAYTMQAESDFDAIFKLFATAPLCPPEEDVTGLTSLLLREAQNAKQIFVTSAIDEEAVSSFCDMPSDAGDASGAGVQILLYNPEERYANLAERRSYVEACRAQLAQRGFLLTDSLFLEVER